MDAFVAIARFEGEATRTVRKDGLVVVADDNIASRMIKKRGENQRKISVRGHPEINRTALRALPLSRPPRERVAPLPPSASVSKSESRSTKWTVHFTGTTSQEFDLVPGADGA